MAGAPIVIEASGLGKCYRVFDTPRARLLNSLWPGHGRGMQEVWALRDVDLAVEQGESVGVIGRNGSGKSTLMQILAGTLQPTTGRAEVRGRVAALLELGSGFNPDYTGRENVYLNGLLRGLSRAEIDAAFDDIAAFADIGEVLDRPVKTYSSGMQVRLAFSVQIALDPEIMIVDEALSVGDYFFRQKCASRLKRMRENGLTLLFVTHDTKSVISLCNRTVYLRDGRVGFAGNNHQAIRHYLGELADQKAAPAHTPPAGTDERTAMAALQDDIAAAVEPMTWRAPAEQWQQPGRILGIAFLDGEGRLVNAVPLGATFRVRVYYTTPDSGHAHLILNVRDAYDKWIFSTGTPYLKLNPAGPEPGEAVVLEFEFEAWLEGGGYSFNFKLAEFEPPNRVLLEHDLVRGVGPLIVEFDYTKHIPPFLGAYCPPVSVRRLMAGEMDGKSVT
jgi:lipopolysaccharide transport system ATP-binding protein